MSGYFNCKLCNKSKKKSKMKSKKKHLNSKYHQVLTKCLISRYYFTNPNFLDTEDIFKKNVNDYNNRILFNYL